MVLSVPSEEAREAQGDVRRLVALGAALVVMILAGVAALLAFGSRELDRVQAREDGAMAGAAINRALATLVGDLTTVTVWDQAYAKFRPGGDQTWADEEIGSYFANNRGHDYTIAVSGQGVPFYAWAGERRRRPEHLTQLLADAQPLVRRVRALEATRGAIPPDVRPTDPSLAETAGGLVRSGGQLYLVAVSTVTPENAMTERGRGPGVIVVSAQNLQHQMPILGEIGIAGARIEHRAPHSLAAVPLVDVNGQVLGSVSWTPEHPGLEALKAAAPIVAAAVLAIALVAGWLAWRVSGVVRGIRRHERWRRVAMTELVDARDKAETASLAKGQFLANMSHEIRTPLNGILGMAQVLERSNTTPEVIETAGVIRAAGETLLGMLNDLLDLSCIEGGALAIQQHEFDMEETLTAATRAFAAAAARKNVAFAADVEAPARGLWRGDSLRVRQVISNLAANAVKFTATGEVRVTVRQTDAGLACTVADTGAGIPQERLEQLFQRFSQIDPTSTRRFGGTGLGLAISRELVELMGGTISVTSVHGGGSAFTFELPLTKLQPGATSPTIPPAIRVLAAEDNPTNQLLLTALLEPMGVTVCLAADGAEAVSMFRSGRFDLVLMDIQMPGMNGVDAARRIRAFEADAGLTPTPILAVSANVLPQQVNEYLAAGMNGFVAKPIDAGVLIAAIDGALAPTAAPERALA